MFGLHPIIHVIYCIHLFLGLPIVLLPFKFMLLYLVIHSMAILSPRSLYCNQSVINFIYLIHSQYPIFVFGVAVYLKNLCLPMYLHHSCLTVIESCWYCLTSGYPFNSLWHFQLIISHFIYTAACHHFQLLYCINSFVQT
jgi:hypothetical protein